MEVTRENMHLNFVVDGKVFFVIAQIEKRGKLCREKCFPTELCHAALDQYFVINIVTVLLSLSSRERMKGSLCCRRNDLINMQMFAVLIFSTLPGVDRNCCSQPAFEVGEICPNRLTSKLDCGGLAFMIKSK